MAVIQCSGVPVIYAWKQGGRSAMGCILHYVAVIQCSGVPVIYAQKWGVFMPWVSVHSSVCEI